MINPLLCERCGGDLESDDAISIIEGVCGGCRRAGNKAPQRTQQPPTERSIPAASMGVVSQSAQPTPQAPAPRPPRQEPVPRILDSTQAAWLPPHTPPPAQKRVASPNRVRRRRDLVIGTTLGLILSSSIAGYFVFRNHDSSPSLVMQESEPLKVPVKLTVKPAWASVTVDAQPAGPPDKAGQLTIDLPQSTSAVRWLDVSAPGFHAVRRPLSVITGAGDITIELVQKPYDVAIATIPPEAEVWINGELKGYSPLTMTMLPSEKPRLVVKRPGYAELSRELFPPARGGKLDLKLALSAVGPTVRVETTPPGAAIIVDGQTKGLSPMTLTFPDERRGQQVEIHASLTAHNPASTRVTLAANPDDASPIANLTLEQAKSRIAVATQPPGAKLLVNGADAGISPTNLEFNADQAGHPIEIEALLPGATAKKEHITIPPAGVPISVTLTLSTESERVVFVLASSAERSSDQLALTSQLAEQISRLKKGQEFALISVTDEGLETWPGDADTVPATSEQKVRAYDRVHAARPVARSALLPALASAADIRPNTLWIYSAGSINRTELAQWAGRIQKEHTVVHFVRASSGDENKALATLAEKTGGTLSIVGQGIEPPVAQLGQDD